MESVCLKGYPLCNNIFVGIVNQFFQKDLNSNLYFIQITLIHLHYKLHKPNRFSLYNYNILFQIPLFIFYRLASEESSLRCIEGVKFRFIIPSHSHTFVFERYIDWSINSSLLILAKLYHSKYYTLLLECYPFMQGDYFAITRRRSILYL